MASENVYLEDIKGNVNSNISKRILDKTNLQMWSAISFAVILIGLGIPVWWKTTETYRVSIPYSRIDKLSDLKWTIILNISVFSNNPIRRDKRIGELLSFFAVDNFFKISVIPEHLNENFSDILSFEKREQEHPRPGNIILVELEDSTHETIFLGNERAMYFYPKVSTEKLVNIIKHQILLEKRLIVSIDSTKPSIQSESDFQYNKNRIKLVPRYELIFTNIVPEPEVVKLEWESESVITSYLMPMINQLLPLVHITLKSQWLYFVEIGLGKKKKQYNDSYIFEMNSHSLTTSLLDKKLGLRASKYLCFNLVLYTARCDESPLFFLF
uniref:GPI transamidase component PIG-S n=1 Tax=Clastoptera arizonana TaxID=38151 RepID=A0A1B6DTT3_9HEMI